ncbi:hypothetical protein D3C79_1025020 [compost metagenome]
MCLRAHRQDQARFAQFHNLTALVPEGQAAGTQQVGVPDPLLPIKVGSATEPALVKRGGMQVEVFEQR